MSHRSDQIASVIRRAVQEVISAGLNDPRVRGLISVTGVTLSPDRRQATVKVSVLPAEHAGLTMHGLEHALPHIQSRVARVLDVRRMPRLVLKLDETLKREAAVHAAIKEGRRRDAERHAAAAGPDAAGPNHEDEDAAQ